MMMKLLFKRLGALLYDIIIVFLLLLLITTFAVALFPNQPLHTYVIYRALLFSSWCAIIVYCWYQHAQTLGMRTWHLKLETLHGTSLTLKQCALRFLIAIPSILFFGVGFLWMFCDKQKLALHDRLSKTKIVSYK